MYELNINSLELKHLFIWADKTISGGHFGNGDVIFPEENITLTKLKNSEPGSINVTRKDIEIILIWCEKATGFHGMIAEEATLISKLMEAKKSFGL